MPADPARLRVGRVARRLAWPAFGLAIVASPFRAGILLASRPIPPLYAGFTDFQVSVGELAVVATLALWALSLVADPRPVALGPRFLRWPLAGLVAFAWISVAMSIDPFISAHDALALVAMAGLALYVLNEIGSLGRLVVPLGIMIGVQAVVGLGQVVGQGSVGLAALGELRLDPNVQGVSVVATSAADRLLRAYGLTDHPNILGGVLAFALPLLLIGLGGADRRRAAWSGVALGTGAIALIVTFSRAAWLGMAVALAIGSAMLLRGRHRDAARAWVGAAIGVAALSAILLVPYSRFFLVRADVLDQRVSTEVMSTGERAILVDATRGLFVDRPLTGTGLGTVPLALLRTDPGLTFDAQPAPVVLLDVAAEVGLFGAICYGVALLAPWLALARSSRRWTPELAAASAALAAATVVGFFDYYTWTFAPGRIWAWLLLGLWARAYTSATAPRPVVVPATVTRAGIAADAINARV